MHADDISVRPADDGDRRPIALLFAAVAEERDGIATEPPVDVEEIAAGWMLEGSLVAVAAGAVAAGAVDAGQVAAGEIAGSEIVGEISIHPSWMGFGEIGMMVAANWRGRGVGSELLAAAIEWARERGLHKLALGVFPHNTAAIALYLKFGFVEEGRLRQHVRRADGQLWDLIEMGLLL